MGDGGAGQLGGQWGVGGGRPWQQPPSPTIRTSGRCSFASTGDYDEDERPNLYDFKLSASASASGSRRASGAGGMRPPGAGRPQPTNQRGRPAVRSYHDSGVPEAAIEPMLANPPGQPAVADDSSGERKATNQGGPIPEPSAPDHDAVEPVLANPPGGEGSGVRQ
jgi:hypothetical protein